jgi:biotin operon repressor
MKLDTPYAVEPAARVYNGATPPSAANGNGHRDYLDVSERYGKLPRIQSAADLQKREFPEIRYVVPGIIAPGLTLFAGKPKIGKSWFCLDVALAVAADRYCLSDLKCNVGDVLFIGLEDNERRLRKRIAKLLPTNVEWPHRFKYATEWPRAHEGGTKAIREWCRSTPDPRMVVIDVLAAFRSDRRNAQAPYEADYAAIKELQQIASDYSVAIIVVHHTRKAGTDVDPFDLVSGTLGLSGAADTTLVLNRDNFGNHLYGRGRDIEEIDKAAEFNKETCRWKLLGEVIDVRRSDERAAILKVLLDADEPMSPADIADLLGLKTNNVKQLLHKMAGAGEVVKLRSRRGYLHPDRSDLTPKKASNFDNLITNEDDTSHGYPS